MARITMMKDAITEVRVPVITVLHLTDPSIPGRSVILNSTTWFSLEDANAYAKERSTECPEPQRFAVYDEDDLFIHAYQCGREYGAFTIV